MTEQKKSLNRQRHEQITTTIVEAIEKGAGAFEMPWHAREVPLLRATNAATGLTYRGANIVTLWAASKERRYASNLWATYKQWTALGAQVLKGQRATPVVFTSVKRIENEHAKEEKHKYRRKFQSRWYSVFNAEQVDGWDRTTPAFGPEMSSMPSADKFIALVGARIRFGASHACYRPLDDLIDCPNFDQFKGSSTSTAEESFYATLLHEHIHWTGHENRLNRTFGKRFADEVYAQEELVAELGAAFLCADLGVTNEPRPDHAAYVDVWLKILKAQPLNLFFAASKAERAVTFLHEQDEMRKQAS